MAGPILGALNQCWGYSPYNEKIGGHEEKQMARKKNAIIMRTSVGFDAIIFISALVLGILGATSMVAMPAGAVYALISISGTVALPWLAFIALIIRRVCRAFL